MCHIPCVPHPLCATRLTCKWLCQCFLLPWRLTSGQCVPALLQGKAASLAGVGTQGCHNIEQWHWLCCPGGVLGWRDGLAARTAPGSCLVQRSLLAVPRVTKP